MIESGFSYLKSAPLRFYRPLMWLVRGGWSALKAGLAENTNIDIAVLPYDQAVLNWLKKEREAGRPLILATGCHERYARAVADHLGLFDQTFATGDGINLSACRKRDKLVAEFGEKNFDYAGNSRDDIAVWRSAAHAYVVNPSSGVERAVRKIGNVECVIDSRPLMLKTTMKSLRLHQWLKNLLVFVPLVAAHKLAYPEPVIAALLAFLVFGLCASSVYLLNDLLDLEDDRHHATKHRRPLASGALPLTWALALSPILLVSAFVLAALFLPWHFGAVLVGYYALSA